MGVERDGFARRDAGVENADELIFEEERVVVRRGGEGVEFFGPGWLVWHEEFYVGAFDFAQGVEWRRNRQKQKRTRRNAEGNAKSTTLHDGIEQPANTQIFAGFALLHCRACLPSLRL
jgi:hypothetical protein